MIEELFKSEEPKMQNVTQDNMVEIMKQFLEDYDETNVEIDENGKVKKIKEEKEENDNTPKIEDMVSTAPNMVTGMDEIIEKVEQEQKKDEVKAKEILKQPSKMKIDTSKVTSEIKNLPKIKGGIMGILVVILFVLMAIKPTSNGQTRLQILFSSLLGNTSMKNTYTDTNGITYVGAVEEQVVEEEEKKSPVEVIGGIYVNGFKNAVDGAIKNGGFVIDYALGGK